MTKIPTSEEFLVKSDVFSKPEISNFNLVLHRDAHVQAQRNIKQAMIEFAKLHVEAALKAASEKVIMLDINEDCHIEDDEGNYPDFYVIDKTSILTAYPLDQIK